MRTVPAGAVPEMGALSIQTSVGEVPSMMIASAAPISLLPASKNAIFMTIQLSFGGPAPRTGSPLQWRDAQSMMKV